MRDDGPLAEPLSGDAVTLEPMTLEDLDDVLVIERASFQTPWSRGAFRYELTQNRVARCSVTPCCETSIHRYAS